jgi:hypothetical protein
MDSEMLLPQLSTGVVEQPQLVFSELETKDQHVSDRSQRIYDSTQ